MLRYVTAGESHGQALVTIIEGVPAGLPIAADEINLQLQRRQKGHGRGGRMAIEDDTVEILAGIRNGLTTGSPISFIIRNRDWSNWQDIMAVGEGQGSRERSVHRPRPGHADLGGAIKYNRSDMRDVLERASARETASRVAAGAIFRKLLERFDMQIYSQVVSIGAVSSVPPTIDRASLQDFNRRVESSPVRCADETASRQMVQAIDDARQAGESLGGCFEVGVMGVPPGIGTYASWEDRLDAQLSALLMSIPAIKAVEVGDGVSNAARPGSQVHDEIRFDEGRGIYRSTNRAGGIEGGMSNGEPIWARAYMKPIPTLYKPLISVNTAVWAEEKADIERSDICAVPAASVVGEAMLAFGVARAFLNQMGGDFIEQVETNYAAYREYLGKVWKWRKI
ncbi:MAG TPA: chorismate synthase [Syntrophomonadaceae bacterium]|nr:chorismate synthase [Syntrophomonadaceae bacterium]